jgi:hypothetical protein
MSLSEALESASASTLLELLAGRPRCDECGVGRGQYGESSRVQVALAVVFPPGWRLPLPRRGSARDQEKPATDGP